jgi:lipoprotein-releasing system ATP-binding protein
LQAVIYAENITKSFGSLKVLRGVSLTIAKGEVVSIVGASGAGKTTLLQILGTLDVPTSGVVRYDETAVNAMASSELAKFRNKNIGFIFQFHHLLPEFTALENVCLPAFIGRQDRVESEKKALALLDMLGLAPRAQHKPSELSGGEQQRVAVARSLINDPGVIFADEPSGNLDSANARDLHELFFKLRDQLNQTFVIVTHNEELANMADRKLVMKDGLLVQ